MNLFYVEHFTYLVCTDRFIGWLIMYHLKPGHTTTFKLISICRGLFYIYSTPEELSSDGSLFTFSQLQQFLKTLCVKYRLSSVAYPQSNTKLELAVKTALQAK